LLLEIPILNNPAKALLIWRFHLLIISTGPHNYKLFDPSLLLISAEINSFHQAVLLYYSVPLKSFHESPLMLPALPPSSFQSISRILKINPRAVRILILFLHFALSTATVVG